MRDLVSEDLSRLSFREGLFTWNWTFLLTARQEVLAVVKTCGSKDLSSDLLPRDPAFVAVSTNTIDRSDYPLNKWRNKPLCCSSAISRQIAEASTCSMK